MADYKNYEMQFSRKGYGRIFVENKSDISKVEEIIKEIDPDEYLYYPSGDTWAGKRLVATFSEENFHSIYVGKFDDMDIGQILKKAWLQGIHCFAVFGKVNEFDE